MLTLLRWLRHGPLAFLGPLWLTMGRAYRSVARRIPGLTVRQYIGPYGPFLFLAEFTFSNFKDWGRAQNKGFRFCVEACRGKTCVVDIGAHIGLVAMPVASVLAEHGHLYAFEPAAANARVLRRHLALNCLDKVEVMEAVVGEGKETEAEFYESKGPHGQNSIVLKKKPALLDEFVKTRRPLISIDAFCARRGLRPEVIKIDAEGAEIGILRGAETTLRTCRPTVILSVHPREIELAGEDLKSLWLVLDNLDYEIREIDGSPAAKLRLDEYVVVPREAGQLPKTA